MFDFRSVIEAKNQIRSYVVATPVLSSPMLNEMTGAEVFVKAESLQLTGSFKIRGALNKILSLTAGERAQGIVAFSSGNHGHAVSAACKLLGCQATIVLPKTAPAIKVANCRWWGAEVIFYDPLTQDREEFAKAISVERGLYVVPPFDDPKVIAGQGTVGLELCEYLEKRDIQLDQILVNCSGGGLTSGVFTAVRHYFPNADFGVVEPLGYEKMAASLCSGKPERNEVIRPSILDGITGPLVGTHTLPLIQACNPKAYAISEDEALEAMGVAFKTLKLVLEPGAAASLAAILTGKVDVKGKRVAFIASGGNVDPEVFSRALAL